MREKGIKMVDIGPESAEEKEIDLLVNKEHWRYLLKEHSGRLGCTRKMITGMGKQRLRISFKILMASVLEKYEMAVEDIMAHREAVAEHAVRMRVRDV